MRADTVVAWAVEGALYCPEHYQPTRAELDEGYVTPVFAYNEGWQDHVCDTCVWEAVNDGKKPETLGEQ